MSIEINLTTEKGVNIVTISGDIDAKTASLITEKVSPLAEPASKIIMDMTNVLYMSSAGLRMLLSLYRQTTAKEGTLILVGLSEDLQDTMSVTGFLDFFTVKSTLSEGLTAI